MARTKTHRHEIGIAAQLRPTAKSLIQEAFRIYGAAEDALTAAGEQFEDLVSEARAEMTEDKRLRCDTRHKGTS